MVGLLSCVSDAISAFIASQSEMPEVFDHLVSLSSCNGNSYPPPLPLPSGSGTSGASGDFYGGVQWNYQDDPDSGDPNYRHITRIDYTWHWTWLSGAWSGYVYNTNYVRNTRPNVVPQERMQRSYSQLVPISCGTRQICQKPFSVLLRWYFDSSDPDLSHAMSYTLLRPGTFWDPTAGGLLQSVYLHTPIYSPLTASPMSSQPTDSQLCSQASRFCVPVAIPDPPVVHRVKHRKYISVNGVRYYTDLCSTDDRDHALQFLTAVDPLLETQDTDDTFDHNSESHPYFGDYTPPSWY